MVPILFAQSVMRSGDDSHESNNRHHITVVYRGRYLHPPREQVFLFLPCIFFTNTSVQSKQWYNHYQSFFCIQHSMLKSFDNLLKEGSLKLYGRKIAYDFFIVENFDLTDKAMPPTRACVLKNTLKISLHFLTMADMTKTLKSQIQIMSNKRPRRASPVPIKVKWQN